MDGRLMAPRTDPIVKEVRDNIDRAWQFERDNRRDAAMDLAFLAGDQWPDSVRRDREGANRPMLTINRLPQFVRQVTNDIRQSDLAIKAAPVDDKSDPELARVYNGIIRQIQYQSSADHVYASAAEHQCACGIGWFRVVTEYVDDSAWDQEIKIKLIRNPLSVYWDPAANELDKSDASWMAVVETWPLDAFKAKYPKADATDVERPAEDAESRLFWHTAEEIRIAEYWRKKPYTKVLALLQNGDTIDITDKGEAELGLMPILRTRKQQAYKIESYIVSGSEVLEGPFEWAGKFIPLVPVIGAEVPLEKKTIRYGVIRHARDSQQLYNYARTAAAESIALAPKSPWLITAKMLGKFKALWDTANSKNHPYLPYEPDPSAPAGPKREHAPEIPAAYVQEAQISAEDMKATTGIYDASLGQRSNETSGRAIMARQREGDVANYHFSDNLKRSLEHCGRILLDLIPKVYDNERVVRVLGDDDSEDMVPINHVVPGMLDANAQPVMVNDLSAARFDIRVTIGPSYSTRRVEASDQIMAFLQAIPNAAPLVGDLVAKMQDWPLADEIAKRLKNMLPPQALIDPENPEKSPPPDPAMMQQEELKARGMSAEVRKVEAEAAKAEAEAEALQLQNAGLVDPAELMKPGVFDNGISPSFDLIGHGSPEDQGPPMMPDTGDAGPMPPPGMPSGPMPEDMFNQPSVPGVPNGPMA